MRVVVDTSIWVSALLSPQSNARLVLDAFLDARFVLLYNRESLIELEDVVTRHRFKGKITTSQWKALFKAIQVFGEPVGITKSFETSDPKDDYLLEIALSGEADAVVTLNGGDLLSLAAMKKPKIVNAGQFLKLLGIALRKTSN